MVDSETSAPIQSLENIDGIKPALEHDGANEQIDVDDSSNADGSSNVVHLKTKSILNQPVATGVPVIHDRWMGKYFVPFQYQLDERGLARVSQEKNPELFAGPICVLAMTANPEGAGGGLVIELENKRGKFITLSIPLQRLHEEPRLLAQDLAAQNFYVKPGKEKELLLYLADCRPSEDRISVAQTGWAHCDEPEKLVFVHTDGATTEGYHYQPERYSPAAVGGTSAGSLDGWIKTVFDTSPYPLFAVLAALSAPLLKFADMPTGGFHFWGKSSCGKTTLAQIAASVYGSGADPSDARSNPYIRRWNMTLNAMEGLAAAHNDRLIVFDELGSVDGRNYVRLIYDFAGGQGKAAMDASRNLRKQRTWLTVLLSTGEMSSQAKMEESAYSGGKKTHAKAGALIRLIDIAVKETMFAGREQVDKIKRGCKENYGTLAPAFIAAIAGKFTASRFRNTVRQALEQSVKRIAGRHGELNPIQQRALKQFALAEVAGLLLVKLEIIPGLTVGTVQAAINQVVGDWMPSSAGLTDAERAIVSLRDFILKFKDSRFKTIGQAGHQDKINIAGYYEPEKYPDAGNGVFYLFPEAFNEATAGEAKVTVAALREKGLLAPDQVDRQTHRLTIEGQRVTTYAVKAAILSHR